MHRAPQCALVPPPILFSRCPGGWTQTHDAPGDACQDVKAGKGDGEREGREKDTPAELVVRVVRDEVAREDSKIEARALRAREHGDGVHHCEHQRVRRVAARDAERRLARRAVVVREDGVPRDGRDLREGRAQEERGGHFGGSGCASLMLFYGGAVGAVSARSRIAVGWSRRTLGMRPDP